LVVAGALLAGVGEGVRAANDGASWAFLLDAIGLLLAVGGGFFEARTADMLFDYAPGPARRRAVLLLILGLLVSLIACVLLSSSDRPLVSGVVGAVIVLGVGLGAGGLFSLLWYYGGRYAADRIQERSNDDW
jgi:hypothetical protein